jgi:hypothetical protein
MTIESRNVSFRQETSSTKTLREGLGTRFLETGKYSTSTIQDGAGYATKSAFGKHNRPSSLKTTLPSACNSTWLEPSDTATALSLYSLVGACSRADICCAGLLVRFHFLPSGGKCCCFLPIYLPTPLSIFFLSLCSLASGCLQSDNGLGWLSGFSSGEKQIVWLTH